MSKQADKPKIGSGAKRVAHAIAKAYGTLAQGTASVVTQVCNVAMELYGGEYLPPQDIEFIVAQVARERQWTVASAQARKSEIRTVLATYDKLPDACEAFLTQAGTLTWHNAVRLGRELLASDFNVAKAVRNAITKSPAAKTPAEQMKGACRRIARLTPGGKLGEFRQDFIALCGRYNIKLGLKV